MENMICLIFGLPLIIAGLWLFAKMDSFADFTVKMAKGEIKMALPARLYDAEEEMMLEDEEFWMDDDLFGDGTPASSGW